MSYVKEIVTASSAVWAQFMNVIDRPQNSNVDRNRWNSLSVMSPNNNKNNHTTGTVLLSLATIVRVIWYDKYRLGTKQLPTLWLGRWKCLTTDCCYLFTPSSQCTLDNCFNLLVLLHAHIFTYNNWQLHCICFVFKIDHRMLFHQ